MLQPKKLNQWEYFMPAVLAVLNMSIVFHFVSGFVKNILILLHFEFLQFSSD